MAAFNYLLTINGNLSFLNGILVIDPNTDAITSFTPSNSAYAGTVNQNGNSVNWAFNVNNSNNQYQFHINSASGALITGTVNGNPNPSAPQRGNETDNWSADVVVPPVVEQ